MHRALPATFAAVLSACASVPASTPAVPEGSRALPPPRDARWRASAPRTASPVVVALDAAIDRLPMIAFESVSATGRLRCQGVPLAAVLTANAVFGDAVPAADDARYVLASGDDGRRVLFSLAELDPRIGQARVFLSRTCGGAPRRNRAWSLVAADDATPARNLDRIDAIVVVAAP